MQSASISKTFAGAVAALALCTSSTGAIAASAQHSVQRASISPLVALSALQSSASRAALCGASAAAIAGAASASQGAAPGCVLPAVDAVPPPAVVETPPPPPAEPMAAPVVEGGMGVSPLLLVLGAIAAGLIIWQLMDEDEDGDWDLSPG
jgi:hypothetical protein